MKNEKGIREKRNKILIIKLIQAQVFFLLILNELSNKAEKIIIIS